MNNEQQILEKIEQLERQIEALERLVKQLQDCFAQSFRKDFHTPDTVNPWEKIKYKEPSCFVCGLKSSEGTFFHCQRGDCPSKAIYCGTKS